MRHKNVYTLLAVLALMLCMAVPAFATAPDLPPAPEGMLISPAPAAETAAQSAVSGKAIACGIAIGLASMGGALAMGIASGKASEAVGRQPEADGKIRSSLMLSLVFIETAIIYALLTVILVIFVL